MLLKVLAGEAGRRREVVLLNAAAAVVAAGRARDFREGLQVAVESIDSGKAAAALKRLVETSTRLKPA